MGVEGKLLFEDLMMREYLKEGQFITLRELARDGWTVFITWGVPTDNADVITEIRYMTRLQPDHPSDPSIYAQPATWLDYKQQIDAWFLAANAALPPERRLPCLPLPPLPPIQNVVAPAGLASATGIVLNPSVQSAPSAPYPAQPSSWPAPPGISEYRSGAPGGASIRDSPSQSPGPLRS